MSAAKEAEDVVYVLSLTFELLGVLHACEPTALSFAIVPGAFGPAVATLHAPV